MVAIINLPFVDPSLESAASTALTETIGAGNAPYLVGEKLEVFDLGVWFPCEFMNLLRGGIIRIRLPSATGVATQVVDANTALQDAAGPRLVQLPLSDSRGQNRVTHPGRERLRSEHAAEGRKSMVAKVLTMDREGLNCLPPVDVATELRSTEPAAKGRLLAIILPAVDRADNRHQQLLCDVGDMTFGDSLPPDKLDQERFVSACEVGPGRLILLVLQSQDQTRASFGLQDFDSLSECTGDRR